MSIDPTNLAPVEKLISKESKEKYYRYWKFYVIAQEISQEKPPTKDSLFQYLKDGFEGEKKYAPTTLWSIFSCINKMLKHLYDLDFSVSFFYFNYNFSFRSDFNDSLIFDYRKVSRFVTFCEFA
jgi:hypothetical protein